MDRNEEQNARIQLAFADKLQPVELTADITLPDYRSEISRLLWVRPIMLPPTRFIGGGKADFSGTVRYHILYVGPDGGLYGAESEEGYAFTLPLELTDGLDAEGIELSVQVWPDAVVSRVTGPRKLSVRCRARAYVQGMALGTLAPRLHGVTEGAELYRLSEEVLCGRLSTRDVLYFDLSDSAEIEGGEGEMRIICANGIVFLPDVACAEDSVRCRGEAVIRLLVCRERAREEAAMPETIIRRIPFEKEVPLQGVCSDCRARAMGDVGEIRAVIEDGRIDLEVDMALRAEAVGEQSALLCRDAFLAGHSASCRMGEECLWHVGPCGNRNFSVSGEVPAAETGLSADATLLCCEADAEVLERESDGVRTALSGRIHCHVLYCREGEYGVAELSVPFRVQLDEGSDRTILCATVPVCRSRLSGESVRIDAELLLAVRGCRDLPVKLLAEATFAPTQAMPRADMELCYPGVGDSVWEIGKRYGVSPTELAAANGLPADRMGDSAALATVKYVLIP